MQDWEEFPETEKQRLSRPKIAGRSETLRSSFSGTAHPTSPAPVNGQIVHRTDLFGWYGRKSGAWARLAMSIEAPMVFETVATLRALPATERIEDGQRAIAQGVAAAGDVARAIVVKWSASSAAAHDGWSVFRPSAGAAASGNGRWLRDTASIARAFDSGDATPSIANGELFTTAGATAITDFDDAYEGQSFTVQRGGADIVITHDAAKIDCAGENMTLTTANPRATFVHIAGVHLLVSANLNGDTLSVTASGTSKKRSLPVRFGDMLNADDFDGFRRDGVACHAAYNAALNYASAARKKLWVRKGTILLGGTAFVPSYCHVIGDGPDSTIFKLADGVNGNMYTNTGGGTPLALGGGNVEQHFEGVGFDGNGAHNADFYVVALLHVARMTMKHCRLFNPYGTLLFLSENDTNGTGEGGLPGLPYGDIFNRYTHFEECEFDGYGQIVTNADLNVICHVRNAIVDKCRFKGGGANCLSWQMNSGGGVTRTEFSEFFRGIFCETSFDGSFHDNDFLTCGVKSSVIGDAMYSAIWLASALESYPGRGYACSSGMQVTQNRIHDLTRPADGTTGLVGIRASGPYGDVSCARKNLIAHNVIQRLSASTICNDIMLEGYHRDTIVECNIMEGAGSGQAIEAGGTTYSTANELHHVGIRGNIGVNFDIGVKQGGSDHTYTRLANNDFSQCSTPYSIANTGQTGGLFGAAGNNV